MSENADKPVWPLWRWLLVGTAFALFAPLLVLESIQLLFLGGFILFQAGAEGELVDARVYALLFAAPGGGLLFLVWHRLRWFFKNLKLGCFPDSAILCLLPFFLPLWYVLAAGALFFFFETDTNILAFALFPHCLTLLPLSIYAGLVVLFYGALIGACLAALAGWIILTRIARGVIERTWGVGMTLSITAVLAIVCALAYVQYRTHVLKRDKSAQVVRDEKYALYNARQGGGHDETDLSAYVPFSPTNKLVVIESPGLCITNDLPRLHGALALYPVYAAAAQALYQHVRTNDYANLVQGGTSPQAINALLAEYAWAKFDMTFMLYPSEKQFAKAREKGKTLEMTKIGREAFVFFVSRVNPVDNLTSAQIRDIYGRRVTSWSAVGGKDERILPFQRPEGSGSQTAMERFMGDAPLARPVQEEFQQMMGGIVNRVADYRNYGNAIGFSFRYYVEGMFKHDGVKLLAVDDVMPTAENIRNGTYPLVADVVIVTAGSANPNVKILTDWFLSPKGQELLEKVGYVPLQGKP